MIRQKLSAVGPRFIAVVCGLLAATFWVVLAGAQSPSFVVDDDDPVSSVPSKERQVAAPLDFGYFLMDLLDRASRAFERGDFAAASRYYEAVVVAAPDRSRGHAKLCESYVGMGKLDEAVAACRSALALDGVRVKDYLRFAGLLMTHKERLRPEELAELDGIFAHLEREGVASAKLYELQCELGSRLQDPGRLESCTTGLAKIAPHAPSTLTYGFAYALLTGDREAAQALLHEAQASMPDAAVAQMRDGLRTLAPKKSPRSWWKGWFVAVGGLCLCLGGLLLAYKQRQLQPS